MTTSETLTARLALHPEVSFAVLFGSRASGSPRADSDLDIGVLFAADLSAQQRFLLRRRLAAELGDLGEVDVVDLEEAPPLLAHRALMGSRLLEREPSRRVRFVVRTLAASGDEQHWRHLAAGARLRRVREGRFGRP
jgi:predicted nucleotidyltransferase